MMPEDHKIWVKFIENGLFLPDEVWYDVHVGAGIPLPSGQPDWMDKFVEYSYKKRIDMVWRTGLDFWVVEAKPLAGVVALGQVIFYAEAFVDKYRPTRDVFKGIVTDRVDPDVRRVFDHHSVVVFEVGTDGGADFSL